MLVYQGVTSLWLRRTCSCSSSPVFRRSWLISISCWPGLKILGNSKSNGLKMFETSCSPFKHGSLNVTTEHHPTMRYLIYNCHSKVMSNIAPKWDIYQSPFKLQHFQRTPSFKQRSNRSESNLAPKNLKHLSQHPKPPCLLFQAPVCLAVWGPEIGSFCQCCPFSTGKINYFWVKVCWGIQ